MSLKNSNIRIAVIIPAAGFGHRFGGDIAKQFIKVNGKSILAHTVNRIKDWAEKYKHNIDIIIGLSKGVTLPDDVFNVKVCTGGKYRSDTVINALRELSKYNFDWAMVHDAARPMVAISDIEKLFQILKNDDVGGILAEKVTSTVKYVSNNVVLKTVSRDNLWLAQTPQLFRFSLLNRALTHKDEVFTDESSAIESMGLDVKIIEASSDNIKITLANDLDYFKKHIGEYN